jgi:succinate-semialdehyde dehydrogenase/glutarate-semialdehyde dehydrogenase
MSLSSRLKDPSLFVQKALIGSAWITGNDTIEVTNPANGELIGTVPSLGFEATQQAIAAAKLALPMWRGKTAHERAGSLKALFRLMQDNADDLAMIMTIEQGKPLAEAKGEIAYSASFVEWFAEEGIRAYGEVIPASENSSRIIVERVAIGVAAAITPWNFPSAMIARKVAPALAAGCTIVVKPSELTPFSALALGVLAERAGIPAGVLNIVTGMPQEIGRALMESPDVRKLSFTGSTKVGKSLYERSAATLKRISLELGGNAPFIIMDDADLNLAVDGVIASKFRNAGQTCVCANRIFVQDGVYDRFADMLAAKVARLPVGDGIEPGVQIGPLINRAGYEKVAAHVADATAGGARTIGTGEVLDGTFYRPVILTGVSDTMRVFSEETFGPVAPLFRFSSDEEVVARANGTPFGLAAYLYTQDLSRGFRTTQALEFGMIGLNAANVSKAQAPFGGVKDSGLGREGSKHGLDEYLSLKALHLGNIPPLQPAT